MKTHPSSGSAESPPSLWDDDTRLVRECLLGEEAAWSGLVSKYRNLIFSIPIKYGFSQEDAADVFQSVCLDLVNQLASLKEPRALAAWLIRVAHAKCFRHMKEKGRYGVPEADLPEPQIRVEDIPENLVRELQSEQLIRTAYRTLSERCRRLVEMLFFEFPPRPYEEIAKSLTLATGSIGFIRGRCLAKLRKQLEEMGFQ